jgi:hypothetical protein
MHEGKVAQLADSDPGHVVVLVRCTVGGGANPVSNLPHAHVKGVLATAGMQDAQPRSGLRHNVNTQLLVHLTREGLEFRLTRFDLPPGQIPDIWVCPLGRPAVYEQDRAVFHECTCDDDMHDGIRAQG